MQAAAPSPGAYSESPSTLRLRWQLARRNAPPRRPGPSAERFAKWLLTLLAPSLPDLVTAAPPARLRPFEGVLIERSQPSEGFLSGFWFPAPETPRGAVLMVHPWLHWGQGFLHRRGRIEALRQAGYHVLTFDLGGFGHSAPSGPGFYDRDIEDALRFLKERTGDLPLHLWGVSAGGAWSHPVLSRFAVHGAVFEDVPQNLLRWSRRMAPRGRPCYLFFQHALPSAYRYLDQRFHAPFLKARAVTYIGCEHDEGAPIRETRRLAKLAGGDILSIPDIGHLGSLVVARDDVFQAVLETFERAETGAPTPEIA